MRLHRLQLQAFGPFPGAESVDFDELGAQGLFLLNGPTGAGKTSVLDAIAYALYGQVPGARKGSLKRLRSDHAAPGVAPFVVCEFSAGGRRLEVRRTPEWMRPAKRGGGTTKEQASTQLRERVDGQWVATSQRNDEAAAEIQGLLGMTMEQFTKVILLAQGEFAAFLRATAKDREELLEKLFGTEIYQALELRLIADARAAAAAVAEGATRLAAQEQLARTLAGPVLAAAETRELAADGAEEPLADGGQEPVGGSAGEPAPPSGAELFAALTRRIAAATEHAAAQVLASGHDATQAGDAVTVGEQRLARHAERAAALAEQQRLHAQAADAATWANEVQRHHSAQVLAAGVAAATATSRDQLRARQAADASLAAVSGTAEARRVLSEVAPATADEEPLRPPTLATLERVATVLAGESAVVVAARPAEERRLAAAAELAAGVSSLARAEAEVVAQRAARDTGEREILAHKAERTALQQRALPLEQAQDRVAAGQETLLSLRQHARHSERVATLRTAELTARERGLTARQSWLDALDRRLSLAAAELASQLVDGEPCQVCGSTVHPAPLAAAQSGAVALHDEKKAKTASAAAEAAAQEARTALSAAEQELAVLAARGGSGTVAQAQAAQDTATRLLAQAQAEQERLRELDAAVERAEAAVTTAHGELLRASATVATLTAGNAALRREMAVQTAALERALAGYATLGERQHALDTAQERVVALAAAQRAQATADAAADAAREALREALAPSSFADAPEVTAALLSDDALQGRQRQLADYTRDGTLNAARLAGPDVAAAAREADAGVGAPSGEELAELRRAAERLRQRAADATVALGLAAQAAQQVSAAAAQYAREQELLAPLQERCTLLNGLADAVRGGGDNQLKMTLTSYVLAARLEQVALAASARLSTMSGERYTLSHTDARVAGNRKSGLGLEVVDEWTQQRRDTATLSGGESFMASLALALGLADVVQQESGGLDIETLFVDEGFGSLDEESLDQVMDALEGLRDGGRMVGLVSHVAELKSRIPVHLQVIKGRDGSRLRIGEL